MSSADLEAGNGTQGALGIGRGKWRLTVFFQKIKSPSRACLKYLLEIPNGTISNLSTAPRLINDEYGSLDVPYFPSAQDTHSKLGLVRVINHSDDSGSVKITARDETGVIRGAVTFDLDANGAGQFDSNDLESGNEFIGLTGNIGLGEGSWYLTLSSDLEIDVLSYVLSENMYLVPLHDIAPSVHQIQKLAFFSPESDRDHTSKLRIINPYDEDVSVAISGTDDSGEQTRTNNIVKLTLPALSTVELTDYELETGNSDNVQSGALGACEGQNCRRISLFVFMG